MNPNKCLIRLSFIALLVLLTSAIAFADEVVSKDAAASWLQHLTPLPREINLSAKLTLKPTEIAVVGKTNSSKIIEQAVLELRHMLKSSVASPEKAAFKITLQLGGTEAEALKSLKNAAQAYRIAPESDGHGLRLVALSDRGLYYAGKTLQQLLRARMTARKVEMPLATVTDWPEMETRGLWGSDSFYYLPWLAERKMNYQENISRMTVDRKTKRGHARVKPGTEQLLTLGPRMGIEHVPVVLHLEQLEGTGLFDAYPELRGKDGGKPGAICYSQPAFVGVLADWITELGSQPTVERVDVWFTENLNGKGGCKCEKCSKTNWALAEARTVITAWREAQKRKPGLGLRVLTSEATHADNPAVFAEIPREVGIWYYHSLLTYTARKQPMIDGPVLKEAQAGRWVGVCPSLVAHVGWAEPFTSPQFVHARMSEFTTKGLSGLIGYGTPRTMIARFNIEAAMEWLWNPVGRTPREFALSWAVREKIRNPEKFAEWTDLMGPVEWAIYGSEWPSGEKRKSQESVATLLARAKLPEVGIFKYGVFGSPWGDIQTPAQLADNALAAERGVKLAREIGVPEFIQESLVIQGYADSLKALWELKQHVTPQGIAPDRRAAARQQFARYERALEQARTALQAWEKAVSSAGSRGGHVQATIETLQTMSRQMKQTAAALSVQ
jgi:hypothetical protein